MHRHAGYFRPVWPTVLKGVKPELNAQPGRKGNIRSPGPRAKRSPGPSGDIHMPLIILL